MASSSNGPPLEGDAAWCKGCAQDPPPDTYPGVIFLKGHRAAKEEVWGVLNLMGIQSGRKLFIFGEPMELITKDFMKEKYLRYQQVADRDPAQSEFLWGPGAHAKTTQTQVLEPLTKIHGTDSSSFPAQYEEALHDEETPSHNFSLSLPAGPLPGPSSLSHSWGSQGSFPHALFEEAAPVHRT